MHLPNFRVIWFYNHFIEKLTEKPRATVSQKLCSKTTKARKPNSKTQSFTKRQRQGKQLNERKTIVAPDTRKPKPR
jgi:hypothetical protein